MGLAQFLYAARKLNNIGRWASDFMHIRASVSEHSFFVTQVAQMLGMIEEEHGNSVNWEKLYKKALNHDVVEAFTGDILSNVKNMTPKMKTAVDDIENMIADELLFSKMEPPYRDMYRDMIFDGKDESLEGQILRYSDNIDAMLECLTETKLGNNPPFKKKYSEIREKLKKSPLTSVQFFIEKVLPEYEELLE
ncbi:metal dependent phosphohydrolase [Denitrovibrio acetiphilus DSM 12809]|uniref:Metal dependent phosphohydrolase n=1 Tax=Denitrovibrio acetiphilus (strain DSM 12809 / NBRC 114555 / N2460) TaxID=522772 RepID=D4H7I7_DENA2|nr:HD domain-containing protein [Denitrovibrio acetiphilus]ADD67986.1 metal dependent phosphohydrolase [Denitrovibrio acetiphilus DSM 12809]